MSKKLFFIVAFLSFLSSTAQNPMDVIKTYGSLPGIEGIIYDLVVQPDGKTIYAGSINKYKGRPCSYILRINPDGSVDNSFQTGTGFNQPVRSLALQADGKILVGGFFTAFQNEYQNHLVRMNPDGSLDNSFVSGVNPSGYNSIVYTMKILSDGKVLVGGENIGPNGGKYLVRMNPDGSNDSTFDTAFNNNVLSVALQPDGKIIAGGNFSTYGSSTRAGLIRLNADGSKDDSFYIGIGFSGGITSVAIQTDGKVVVCGGFTTYKGLTQRKIARLQADGSLDTTFDVGTGFPNSTAWWDSQLPEKLVLDSSGNIFVGGSFGSYNGNADTSGFVKILPTGVKDPNFTVAAGRVLCIQIESDGKISVAGSVHRRILPNGTLDPTFDYGSGFNGSVESMLIQPDGKYIVSGSFSSYQMTTQPGMIRFNADGTKDTSFVLGSGVYGGRATVIVPLPDGKFIVGGEFGDSNGIRRIVRLNANGSLDTTFNAPYIDGPPTGIIVQSNGKYLVGGVFPYVNGQYDPYIMRLNANGSRDLTFDRGTGFNGVIRTMVQQPDGKILIGGDFTIYRNEPHERIVRILPDGAVDPDFFLGDGFNNPVHKITLQPDGKIICAGDIGSYNSQSTWGICRLNSNGTLDTSFNSGFTTSLIRDVALQNDGKIITAGYTSYFTGTYLSNFVRFNPDGTTDTTFNPNNGFINSALFKIGLFANGNILLGGSFAGYNNIDSANLIMLRGGEAAPLANATFNRDQLVLYPNPAKELIHINLPKNIGSFTSTIYDMTGKIVSKQNEAASSIDVQTLSKGIYLLKATTGTEVFSARFIKE